MISHERHENMCVEHTKPKMYSFVSFDSFVNFVV